MSDRYFVDTNILVYAHDVTAGLKHKRARALVERLWHSQSGVLSTQVLQEFCANVRKKPRAAMSLRELQEIIEDFLEWEIVVNGAESISKALAFESRYRISFWDALILQAAGEAGVSIVYSEDLNEGQVYGSVRVVNPLADSFVIPA